MSLNIQTANGLLEIGGKVTKEKVISALGYSPANEDDLPNITEDQSGALNIADESGNVVLRVDSNGVHTTEITAKGVALGETVLEHIDDSSVHVTSEEKTVWNNKSDFSGVYDDLINAPNITENGSGEFDIADESGNIILKVDSNGLETTAVSARNVVVDGKDVLSIIDTHTSNKTIHVTAEEKEIWNNKSDFSGAYADLEGQPDIMDDESGNMIVADKSGNIIMQIDADGLETTTVTAKKLMADGKDVLSIIDNHISDSVAHVTAEEKEIWNNKSDFSGIYDDLINAPNIKDDETGVLNIADESGNIILKVNANGLETTSVTAQDVTIDGINVKTKFEDIKGDINGVSSTLGSHASDTNIHIDSTEREKWNKDIENLEAHKNDEIKHITAEERSTWNNKSDFSGNYNDLIDAPNISDDDTGALNIADESGNVILKVDKDGLETTTVTTNEVILNGTNVEVELKGLGDKFDNLDSDLDSHSSDTNIHITAEERNTWNLKATTDYVDQKVAGVVNSAPETLDTLNELATALGNDKNFATTVTNSLAEKATKEELNTHANNTDIHIIDSERDKWDKNIEDLDAHINDDVKHITSDERNTWNNKSDFSGNYNDLVDAPNISNDDSGELNISDESGNIILKVDKDGLETTAVAAKKIVINETDVEVELKGLGDKFDGLSSTLSTHANDEEKHIAADERSKWDGYEQTISDNTSKIKAVSDLVGQDSVEKQISDAIAKENLSQYATDSDLSAHTSDTDIHITSTERNKWNKNIEDLNSHVSDEVRHITSEERNAWNNKSDFSGIYDDLVNAPSIKNDESGRLEIADESENVILRVDKDGLETTTITAKKIIVNKADVEVELGKLNDKIDDVNSTLSSEIDEVSKLVGEKSVETQITEAITKENLSQYATDSDLSSHTSRTDIHITSDERAKWNGYETTISGNTSEINGVKELVGTESVEKQISDAIAAENLAQYATDSDLNSHTSNTDIHITSDERSKWNKNIEDLDTHKADKVAHITSDERNTWNNKSEFSGNYNDLVDAPDISDNDETGELNIVDKSGNIIVRVDKDGLETTTVVAKKVEVNGTDVESKLSEFDSHVSDVTDSEGNNICTKPHVKDTERTKWDGYQKLISDNTSEIGRVSGLVGSESVEKQIEDAIKAENLAQYAKASDLNAHTSDITTNTTGTEKYTSPHVKDSERTKWDAKATTDYVDKKVADLVNSAPDKLNTLDELAAALGDDENFATTVTNQISLKADKADLNSHVSDVTNSSSSFDTNLHVKTSERTKWNGYESTISGNTGEISRISGLVGTKSVEAQITEAIAKENLSQYATDSDLNSHTSRTDIHITSDERDAWNNKSEFSGAYEDLVNAPNITEDESGELVVVDRSDNIILRVDATGLETTTVKSKKVEINGIDVESKISEFDSHVSDTFDSDSNIICTNPHVKDSERTKWDGYELTISGNTSEIDRVSGLVGTETVQKQISDAIKDANLDQYATDSDLNTHTSDTIDSDGKVVSSVPHVKDTERTAWNAKPTKDYVDTELAKKTDKTIFDNHVLDITTNSKDNKETYTNPHVKDSERTKWNGYESTISGNSSEISKISGLVGTESVNKQINDAIKAEDLAQYAKASVLNGHTSNTDIHVTISDKEKWNNKSDFSGVYDDLVNAPSITEDKTGELNIIDESENIILRVDKNGLETTTVTAKKVVVNGKDVESKIDEFNTHVSDITDSNSNIICSTPHVKDTERTKWDGYESTISGNTSEISKLSGLVGNKSVETQISDAIKAENLAQYAKASDLNLHTSDITESGYANPHVSDEERTKWNAVDAKANADDVYTKAVTNNTFVAKADYTSDKSTFAIKTEVADTYVTKDELTAHTSTMDGKLEGYVVKETGKGLSTNDFTADYKAKLDGIAEGANNITVDTALSATSENPVQNKIVNSEINNLKTLISGNTDAINNITHPVSSVNGKTGVVTLSASDVGALPDTTVIPSVDGLATTEYVGEVLKDKVDSAEISHTTEQIPEGAVVTNGKLSIVVDAYTKSETLEKIQEKITEINGGESAGEVLSALNSYKETNDARVGAIETKNTSQDTKITSIQKTVDVLDANIKVNETGRLEIADESENVILRVDKNGLETTTIVANEIRANIIKINEIDTSLTDIINTYILNVDYSQLEFDKTEIVTGEGES